MPRRRRPRPVRFVLGALMFGLFLAAGVVLGVLILPLCQAGARSARAQAKRDREVLRACFVQFIRVLRRLGFVAYAALPPDRPRGPCVIVANHPSLLDVLFILAAVPDVTVVIKDSWMRAPLLGSIARRCGYLAAEPGRSAGPLGEPAVVLERVAEALRGGTSVLIFPEGTRSPRGGLRRFHVGACEAARRAGVPVWPFVVEVDDGGALGRGWFSVPDDVVRVHLSPRAALDPADWPDARAMNRALRARYEAWLGVRAPVQDVASRLTPARTEV